MGMETRSRTHARYALSVGIVLNLPTCVQGAHVEEIVASASLIMIGHAAFHAAVEQYPGASLTLRQGTRVILKSPGCNPGRQAWQARGKTRLARAG